MKLILIVVSILIFSTPVFADPCDDRFAELLIPNDRDQGPVRLHITQEIIGGKTSTNYHYSDGKGNGMTEMIEPADLPRSLFIGDNMYSSNDKGKSWQFMNSYDAKKSLADLKKSLTKAAAKATDVVCGKEDLDGVSHEVVEGNYISATSGGAAIYEKTWVDLKTRRIVKSFRHFKSSGFESKTTQVVEPYPELKLPKPDK